MGVFSSVGRHLRGQVLFEGSGIDYGFKSVSVCGKMIEHFDGKAPTGPFNLEKVAEDWLRAQTPGALPSQIESKAASGNRFYDILIPGFGTGYRSEARTHLRGRPRRFAAQSRRCLRADLSNDIDVIEWHFFTSRETPTAEDGDPDTYPFTRSQLALIDEVQAYFGAVLQNMRPDAVWVTYKGGKVDINNGRSMLKFGKKRFLAPRTVAYGVALRIVSSHQEVKPEAIEEVARDIAAA
jgi:hypothetical protein